MNGTEEGKYMFGTFLTLGIGVGIGLGTAALYVRGIRRAVDEERKRGMLALERATGTARRLRAELQDLKVRQECGGAYRYGYERGRTNPMSAAEKFGRTFEARRGNVEFIDRAKGAEA